MANNLTARVYEGASFQYRMTLNSSTTVAQATDAAAKELKRTAPDIGNTQLRSVRHKDNKGRVKEEIMDPAAKMQPSYELQLEVEDADIIMQRRQERAFRRFILKRHVISFASSVSARMVSGLSEVPRSGPNKNASGVQTFLQSPEVSGKIVSFLRKAMLSGEPADFAVALDENYDQRNVAEHDTTDKYLEETAAELMEMGALCLLGKEHPWQCALIEHFALVKSDLFA
ncbi:hypothetical protein PLESTB_001348700 [Pleodorina starrii]|uniref:Uncharacterized protein n=1 Tax=Pleodorina starrii TaxID=330485 RepID=A0A9W6BUC3_9CHLO|nr:hypothetical protein PLESTB_001348700 [Pleodorina starrii]